MIWCPETGANLRVAKKELDAFSWISDGEHFVVASGQHLWIMDKEKGTVKNHYCLPSRPLRVHDIASVPGKDEGKGGLLVVVCSIQDEPPTQEPPEGFLLSFDPLSQRVRPKDVQPQRRIIICDINKEIVAAAVPVRSEARHVTVSRNGRFALISYGPSCPPELWHIETSSDGRVLLELCHMYLQNSGQGDEGGPVDLVGQARFGGDCDEYVVVVTRNGEVYVWDCLSSHLCHKVKDIRVSESPSKAIGISWCSTNDERKFPLFACGMDDGSLVIWQGSDTEAGTELSSRRDADVGKTSPGQEIESGGAPLSSG